MPINTECSELTDGTFATISPISTSRYEFVLSPVGKFRIRQKSGWTRRSSHCDVAGYGFSSRLQCTVALSAVAVIVMCFHRVCSTTMGVPSGRHTPLNISYQLMQ
eukprot:Amastigsp_a796_8.p3 type:complete len:105 gc:universal Amastigsp_a796_8:536-222(-)